MEYERFSGNDEMLVPGSEVKIHIQNQLFGYIIGVLEDRLEGYHAQLGDMTVHENPYALFLIEELSEKIALWFEAFCSDEIPPSTRETVLSLPKTVQNFYQTYNNQPEKVLTEVIAHRNYSDVEEYLRELVQWFKVKQSPPDESQEVMRESLVVPMRVHFTREAVSGIISKSKAEAESESESA